MAAPASPKYKLILLGDFGVGKTTLFHRVRTGSFLEGPHGVGQHLCVCEKVLPLRHNRSSLQAQISLWDTAGEERFLSLSSCYYRRADAALLVYSLHGPLSFDNLTHWVHVVRQYCAEADIFLLGNKSDLESRVPDEKAERFSVEHSTSGRFKVSAKTGENVERCLQEVADCLVRKEELQRSGPAALPQELGYCNRCGR